MERKSTVIVGAPRRGKTYYAEKMAIAYARAGGVSVAYNVGMPKDFRRFISVTLITPRKKVDLARGKGLKIKVSDLLFEITHFAVTDTGATYKIEDFCRLFAGKCVKIERLNPREQEERLFFKAIFKHFYNAYIVLDDFRAITRTGLSSELIELISRQNHAGKMHTENCGVDISLIYHNFESVSPETFAYTNSIVQFFTNQPPLLPRNSELEVLLLENYTFLKTAPKYSRCEVDTQEYRSKKIHI